MQSSLQQHEQEHTKNIHAVCSISMVQVKHPVEMKRQRQHRKTSTIQKADSWNMFVMRTTTYCIQIMTGEKALTLK